MAKKKPITITPTPVEVPELLHVRLFEHKKGKIIRPEDISPSAARAFSDHIKNSEELRTQRSLDDGCPVVLREPGQPCRVLGKEKPKLTAAQYNVVAALLAAGDDGLTKDQLIRKSNGGGAIRTMKDLAGNDDDWGKVLFLAGKTGGRYRIAKPR